MAAVTLEYDPETEVLVLAGADERLARNPLFAGYIRQASGSMDGSRRILLPTKADALSGRYQSLAKMLQRLGIELQAGGHVSDALDHVEAEERRFAEFSARAQEIWHRQIDTDEFRTFVSVVEDACPGRSFYRKQLLSAYHLAFAQNACNFSVPGAGKTSIVYAAYAYLSSLPSGDPKSVDRLLIVGPLASFKAWEDEFRDIFRRPARARRISGAVPAEARSEHLRGITVGSRGVELTLTSYQTLANSEEDFRVFLRRGGGRTMMVLDEAHYIKSSDGQQAAAALRLAPLARSRVVLTGTPAPNGYEDLSNLFRFIYPTRHIVGFPAATLRAMTDGSVPTAVNELKTRIQPFFTRIRKDDLGLPPVHEERVAVEMSDGQERIYRALERRIVPRLRQELDGADGLVRVRARLIRLRQASVNPELLLRPLAEEGVFETDGGDFTLTELEVAELIRSFDAQRDLRRLQVCRDLAERILREQGKVLIWSYFLGNLERLRSAFGGRAPFVEVLTGATPVAGGDPEDDLLEGTREAIIDRFHREAGPAVLIANPQAVGESISLHKACRSAIYFDRDFNAGRYIQSKDRIHRYNPAGGEPVGYYHLVSAGTVDEDIDTRLAVKERRLADLVDAEDIPLLTASDEEAEDDIRAILEAYEHRKTR